MGPVAPFIPAILGIGGSIAGSVGARKAGQAAMAPSAEEKGYLNRQGQLSDLLRGQGEQTFNEGMPGISRAMSYYDTMARGDRSKMSQAIAPSVAQITQQYRGAEGSIDRNLRGAQKQQQKGELRRQRASQLALLTTGQQSGAYDKMNATGQALVGQSGRSLMGAGNLMESMLDNSAERRKYGRDVERETGKGFGGLLGDILKGLGKIPWGRGKGFPTPKSPEGELGNDPWPNAPDDPNPGDYRVPRYDLGPGPFGGPVSPVPYAGYPTPGFNNLPPQFGGRSPDPYSGGRVIDPNNPNQGPPTLYPAPPEGGYQYDDDNPSSPWYTPRR